MAFKTTINCGSCLAKVTPALNRLEGVNKWEVNLQDSRRVLTVEAEGANEEDVVDAVESVGFDAERM